MDLTEGAIDRAASSGHDLSMWEAIDPDGRRVILTFAAWRHIVERHPELDSDIAA